MARVPVERIVGFECEFLTPPPPNLQTECPVCLQITREPQQVTCCGKKFCQSCIQTIKDRNKPCPLCNAQEFTDFPDIGHKLLLYDLKVRCSHQREGCEWTGELRYLEKHLNTDPQPENQLEGCPLTTIDCDFHHVGCTVKLPRRDMSEHLKNSLHQHMSLLVASHTALTQKHLRLETAHTKLGYEHTKLADGHNTLVENHTKLVENHTKLVEQHVLLEGSHKRMKREYENLSSSSAQLLGRYEELRETCDKLTKTNQDIKSQLTVLQLNQPPIVRPVPVPVPVPIPPPHLTRSETLPIQPSGILEMDNYEQYKRDNHWWYSIPIHTHHQGYKFCLGVVADGHGTGRSTHLSAFVFFMSGDYDDYLTWPFRGSISIQLLDHNDKVISTYLCIYGQQVGADYCQRVLVGERAKLGWGAPKFISHTTLKRPILAGGRLRFRISGGEARV